MIYPTSRGYDPMLMMLLSLLIVGLGQMVVGQVAKGVAILLGSIILAALTFGLSVLVTWPLAAIDAYMIANKLRHGRPVGKWEFF